MPKKIKYPIWLINFLAFLAFVVTTFMPLPARAQQAQDIANQQDWISRQQQQQKEKKRRLREQEAIKKEKNQRQKEAVEKKISTTAPKECFPLKQVKIIDADSISKRQQKKLMMPFIGQCIGSEVLSGIVATMKNHYNDEGYVLARIFLVKKDLENGELEIRIAEEKIDEIIIGNNSFTDKMQKLTAFGNIEGKPLSLDDLNQGIFQINRLPSNNAEFDVEPSEKEDSAKVIVTNKNRFPARASVAYDSLGNDYTGVDRTTFSAGVDNLLFLNDAINLSYTANLNSNNKIKNNKAFTGDFSIPFGYNTFSYEYSRSEFVNTEGIGQIDGYTTTNEFTLSRLLLTKNNWRVSTNVSLNLKSAASYLNHQKIDISERKLSIGSAEFEVSNDFENGVSLYLKPTYSQGLKILGAKNDDQDFSANSPRAQFRRYKLSATLSKKFTVPKTKIPVLLATEMDSQFSRDVLFGSEEFSVGGYYSVRGFRDNYLVGASGYYFRNSANFNVGSLVLPWINGKNLGWLSNLNKFQLEPFYDYGHITNNFTNNSGRLAGAGIKTIFESNYFNASLTYSAVTNRSQLLPSNKKENKMIYFEISLSCCDVDV